MISSRWMEKYPQAENYVAHQLVAKNIPGI